MEYTVAAPSLGDQEFQRISAWLHELTGIQLRTGKESLVQSRLARRLRALELPTYGDYLRHVEADATGAELTRMVDALTTNKTSFWREPAHFEHLRDRVLPELLAAGRPIRLWSAGCATGEEPYTLTMLLAQAAAGSGAAPRLLATDISTAALERARAGIYPGRAVDELPADLRKRYLVRDRDGDWSVTPAVRNLVSFAQLNLMGPWPMRGPLDAIFCRNVMIYFDRPTQEALVRRFHGLLAPGGYLYVGHAESLSPVRHEFEYVLPAVYRRPQAGP